MPAHATPSEVSATPRRDDIRAAAVRLFAERGYYGTGMRDIAEAVGMRASSLYNHVDSKQTLLREIMVATMATLLDEHERVLRTTDDCAEQLRRSMEAHVRYHARHPLEVQVGNREIASLDEPARGEIRELRRRYAQSWQALIERGIAEGRFETASAQLSTYAILEMGIGVSLWYREGGPLGESEVAYHYGDMALRLVQAAAPRPRRRAAPRSRGAAGA
ncbi:TetR/AcrR family transcriptional regulator [Conexibacter arvalis]|uniref:AcrR family transcriptional regulator n=1 Tax=Conexibacter arvalis TaxID=912552 RepID=A0A840I809_9ACTN|nr:TetR/AcrR family transcriptional regulator [Conexibacter arvalis]MBB4660652.1 AcrR family transcriptional regulator [Conexibacter arvalis]